jgi:hypothetical protein
MVLESLATSPKSFGGSSGNLAANYLGHEARPLSDNFATWLNPG